MKEERPVKIAGRSVVVPVELDKCPNCHLEYWTDAQITASQKAATEVVREQEGLLSPDEIAAIRASLRLSQEAFERLLGVGAKTVVRWEKGLIFQSKAADSLLRLVREDAGNAARLAEWHGVSLPQVARPAGTVEVEPMAPQPIVHVHVVATLSPRAHRLPNGQMVRSRGVPMGRLA